MDAVDRILSWLTLLVDAAAVTGDEQALADELEGRLAEHTDVVRVGDSLVAGSRSGERPCVALVGHLDVVPPTPGDLPLRVEGRDDDRIAHGRGTSDMHAGNAVALDLFSHPPSGGDVDLVLVLYAREEGPADDNELADVIDHVPWLADVDLAVVLEPTDGQVQLGCLGGIHARVRFVGQQAHSARPWHGRNALTAAGPLLASFDALEPEEIVIDGVKYLDVWSVTQGTTTNPRNVIPGTFDINLNLRFSPSRSAAQAETELRQRIAAVAGSHTGASIEIEIVDVAPPAPPRRDAPLVQTLLDATAADVAGKQAWTDVARFAALDVPAVNYGPGLTAQAHQRGEHVHVAAIVDVHARLRHFLSVVDRT